MELCSTILISACSILFPDSAHPIVFKPSLKGKPGLPGWLNYRQTDPSEGVGYMYGTPGIDNVGNFKFEVSCERSS